MGGVRLTKVPDTYGEGQRSWHVRDPERGDLGIVHKVERRFNLFVPPRTGVEWDPVAWVGRDVVRGPSCDTRGAAVTWILAQHELAAMEAARPEPSVGPGDVGNLPMDSLVDRCAKATGSYASDVDVILAWLIEQSGTTHTCPVCQQGT